jgi:hypothetical protein
VKPEHQRNRVRCSFEIVGLTSVKYISGLNHKVVRRHALTESANSRHRMVGLSVSRAIARRPRIVREVNSFTNLKRMITMSETNTPPTTSADTGASGQKQSSQSTGDSKESLLMKAKDNLPHGGSPVGVGGIILSAGFLIFLTVALLYGITKYWPVCDLPDENQNTNGAGGTNANDNRSTTSTNTNSSVTTSANVNLTSNQNTSTPTNTNARIRTQANTNASAPSPGTSPTPANDVTLTKLDADSIEPNSGPTTGKTLVIIRGKNFGTKTEDIKVKFGELKANVNQVSNDSISVRTPMHSEGIVDVSVEKSNGEKDVLTSKYTYTCPPPTGSGLFYMLIMAGGLGGCIHALRSLYWYTGQGELKWRWLPMYFALPFIGAAMAMIFSLLIIAGFVDNTTGRSEALFIIAIAGLVGMFSQQAALKLTDVANAFFTKPGEGKDAEPQKSLSVSQRETKSFPLTVTAMTPTGGNVVGGEEVKITGSGFSTSTTVNFGSVAAKVKSFDSTSITVVTPPGTGEVEVEVKSDDQSVKLPVKFKYT